MDKVSFPIRRSFLALVLALAAQACLPAGGARSDTAARSEEPPPTIPSAARLPRFKGKVADFTITNDAPGPLSRRVASFGQIFRPGQVQASTRLTVTLNGAPAAAQMDPKAFNPDGSVRHAVLSVMAPPMSAGAAFAGVIRADGVAPRTAPGPSSTPALVVEVTPQSGADKGKVWRIDLARLAATPAKSAPAPWLNGPLVREQRYASARLDGLQVMFDVWTPVAGAARVDVIFHNDTAQNPDIDTLHYDVGVSLDNKPVYRAQGVTHHRYQTWRKTIYADGAPPLRVSPDPDLLRAAGAVPRYGRFRPDPGKVEELHGYATLAGRPLTYTAGVTPYMPTTGGRTDIGPLPAWAAFYVMDPSRKSHETLLANADVAGSIPWHVRDISTDGPIRADQHPDAWLDYRAKAAPGVLPRPYRPDDGIWTPDDAHQPSLTYLPYLITGSQYYRDELAMQAGYVLLAINPAYRGGAKASVLPAQLRAIAWNLRTLANAAYILPTEDRLQRYFQAKLESNLAEMNHRFVKGGETASAGELVGYIPGAYDEERTSPWQDDYLVIVLAWIDAMGFHEAHPVLAWMTNFVAGRFTNAERGFDPIYGTPYFLHIADPNTKKRLDTWSAAFRTSFDPVKEPVKALDYPEWGGGYAALARASLASLLNTVPTPQARAAYAFVRAHTSGMEANYSKEPAFAIVPIAPEEK